MCGHKVPKADIIIDEIKFLLSEFRCISLASDVNKKMSKHPSRNQQILRCLSHANHVYWTVLELKNY
jgi:hypothetical protein